MLWGFSAFRKKEEICKPNEIKKWKYSNPVTVTQDNTRIQ